MNMMNSSRIVKENNDYTYADYDDDYEDDYEDNDIVTVMVSCNHEYIDNVDC